MVSSRANSSPPSRAIGVATRGPRAGAGRRSRSSSRSPTWWPRASLTSLNWSRSITSSATGSPVRLDSMSSLTGRSAGPGWAARSARRGGPGGAAGRHRGRVVTSLGLTPTNPRPAGRPGRRGSARSADLATTRSSSISNDRPSRATSASHAGGSSLRVGEGFVEGCPAYWSSGRRWRQSAGVGGHGSGEGWSSGSSSRTTTRPMSIVSTMSAYWRTTAVPLALGDVHHHAVQVYERAPASRRR